MDMSPAYATADATFAVNLNSQSEYTAESKVETHINVVEIPKPQELKMYGGNTYVLSFSYKGSLNGVGVALSAQLISGFKSEGDAAKHVFREFWRKVKRAYGLPDKAESFFYALCEHQLNVPLGNNSNYIQNTNTILDVNNFQKPFEDVHSAEKIAYASLSLPGMNAKVSCPETYKSVDLTVKCSVRNRSLWSVIQHLNDTHNWTREAIADWVDELHEAGTINAEFQPWGELDDEFES